MEGGGNAGLKSAVCGWGAANSSPYFTLASVLAQSTTKIPQLGLP